MQSYDREKILNRENSVKKRPESREYAAGLDDSIWKLPVAKASCTHWTFSLIVILF